MTSISTQAGRVLLVAGLAAISAQPVAAATGAICDQFGATTQGNYVVMNNRWGTSATQCINVTNNGFQITQQDGSCATNGAPCAYPAIYFGCHYGVCSPGSPLPAQISQIGSANTNVTLSYPGSGVYDAAYDIWINADTNVSGVQDTEIMIWLNHTGVIQPIGSNTGTVALAGRSWAVWVGNNGANNVVSYVQAGITSFSADLKPFLLDAMNRGSGFGNTSWYLTSAQMGFEPWSGGVGLAVNSFAASISSGPAATATPTPRATATPTAAARATATATSRATATGTPRATATATTSGGISTTTWYRVVNRTSAKCVDARGAATANGTVVQQFACNGSNAQGWQFAVTSGGYYRLNNRNNAAQVWDVSGSADGSPVRLWSYSGANNQQWLPVAESGGYYHFVARNSGKCLDVPGASTADSVQLVEWACNGTGAQSFLLAAQ